MTTTISLRFLPKIASIVEMLAQCGGISKRLMDR